MVEAIGLSAITLKWRTPSDSGCNVVYIVIELYFLEERGVRREKGEEKEELRNARRDPAPTPCRVTLRKFPTVACEGRHPTWSSS